jgi:hypothetical protein
MTAVLPTLIGNVLRAIMTTGMLLTLITATGRVRRQAEIEMGVTSSTKMLLGCGRVLTRQLTRQLTLSTADTLVGVVEYRGCILLTIANEH